MSRVNPLAAGPVDPPSEAGAPVDPGFDLATVKPAGKPFLSRGHFAGRWTAEVAANALAAPLYAELAPSTKFTVGSVLVKKHALASSSAPGPTFALVKREAGFFPEGGDWEYVALDAEGRVEDRGRLALCARCHAEASADWVFGLPPEAR